MILAESAPRSSGRVRRLLNWDAMPLGVRVLVVVLLVATVEETLRIATPLLDGTVIWHDAAYNAVLVGSAALCAIKAALHRTERVAWAMMGLALALWAGGEIYRTEVVADAAEAPFPSLADALWLGFLPPPTSRWCCSSGGACPTSTRGPGSTA